MKNYEGSTTLNHTWAQVASTFWKRYPNRYSKHVLSEDTLERKINENGQLVSKRLLVKTNSCPKWLERLTKSKNVHVLEESIVDPIKQTITVMTRNLGLTKIMLVEETCVYKRHPDSEFWTKVERKTNFETKLNGILRYAILKFGLERYKYNIKKTDSGFQQVISNNTTTHRNS